MPAGREPVVGDEVGHVHRAGGGPHDEDPVRVAAQFHGVLPHPGQGRGQVLGPGREGELRSQPVGDVDPDHAVADRPERDVVVVGRARLAQPALHEAAAVDEDEHRTWGVAGLGGEGVQPVALVRPVGDAARDGDAGVGLRLLLGGVDGLGAGDGRQDLPAEAADLLGVIGTGHGGSGLVG